MALARIFDFKSLVQNILKEADINFVFKILAIFCHNKGIHFFSHRRGWAGVKFGLKIP